MTFSRFLISFVTYGVTALVLLIAGGMWLLNEAYRKPGPLSEETFFTVERGDGVRRIAEKLEKAGAIEDPLVFTLAARIAGVQSELKAGEYLLNSHVSSKQIMQLLRDGHVYARQFTVPEGRTSYEIVRILNSIENLTGKITEIPPEGSLLPETYNYQKGDSRAEKIIRMKQAMKETIKELCAQYAARPELVKSGKDEKKCWPAPLKSIEEVITLASIVEKETAVPAERCRVAGVFINRLKRGIPLQTDPTVIYAITNGKHDNDGKGPLGRRLLRKDLEIESPYNTYKYSGLPPGPIANPGRASIEAVLNPEEHDFVYFVADGTGGHAFSKTLREHNRNVAKWRKIRRSK